MSLIVCRADYGKGIALSSMSDNDGKAIMKSFGLKVKEKRAKLDISQEELAFRSGLHRTYISDIERGSRNVSLINIKKISQALKVKSSELLDI